MKISQSRNKYRTKHLVVSAGSRLFLPMFVEEECLVQELLTVLGEALMVRPLWEQYVLRMDGYALAVAVKLAYLYWVQVDGYLKMVQE